MTTARVRFLAPLLGIALLVPLVPRAASAITFSEAWSAEEENEPGDVISYTRWFDEDGPRLTSFTVTFEHIDGHVVKRHDPSPARDKGDASWLVRPDAPRGTWSIAKYRAGFADGSEQTGVPREGNGIEFRVIDEQPSEQGDWVGPEGYPCGPSFQGFRDVCLDNTFRFDIHDLALAEITTGCSEHLFCPDHDVTRGQMAAFLTRALDLPRPDTVSFRDTADSVFVRDIEALAAADITRGCDPPDNDHFCPDRSITRAQLAAFLVRALDLQAGPAGQFEDVAGDHRFHDEIGALAAAGITKGCNPPDNDRFCPGEPVTREQMAAFLFRAGLVV